MDRLLLVDGNSIANRAFYALPFLSNHEGKPSGAVYGFANILIKLIQNEKPSHLIVAFDHARKTFRNDLYADYKMQRKPTPNELIEQFPLIKQMLDSMGIIYIEQEGIEADDIIGTVSKKFNGEKFILSGDKDLLQLIDKDTTVWLTKKGVSEVDKVDELRLQEMMGLKPYQIIELKSLMGDTSDNIPGVKGVGEKTALDLLAKYQELTNIYANIDSISGKLKEKLLLDKEMAFISKQLATINRDCKVEVDFDKSKIKIPFGEKTYSFFKDMDFSSLIKNTSLYNLELIEKKSAKVETTILTQDILKEMAQKTNVSFSYELANMKFFFDNKIYMLEKNFSMFEEELKFEDVCEQLKNIFEDELIVKITPSAKNDMHLLSKLGIELNNFFDLNVADYVLNAGNKSANYKIEVNEYLARKEFLEKAIRENDLTFVYQHIEKPLVKLLFEMEKCGFKINESRLDEISQEFYQKQKELEREIFEQSGEMFNINSPKQVASILFDKLGIQAYNNKKQSTSATVLDELRHIPIVDNILTYRKYSKLINTYLEVYKNICKTTGDIIHTTFNQTLTSTGRLSSSEPNLQNIPTRDDEGKILRKIFVSKFDGGKILSADYSQIELRLLADMSGESQLISAYNRGDDIHSLTASQIFNIPLDQVDDSTRRDAKAVNFGIIYGISDYGLSQNIKSSRAKAKDYIDSYFARYPKVKEFMDNNIQSASEKGYAITKYGRIRRIPELSSAKYMTRTFGQRVAMNMPLQGTASDIIKLAMLKVAQSIKENNLKSQLILQIHDELIIDVYPGELEKVKHLLISNMENVVALNVPLKVSIGEGENLYDCK
ncbi:MAG: DNA polymerase I [Clostridiales bacterium]|nr:DNA polymerase I [Clostridiales bacterium]